MKSISTAIAIVLTVMTLTHSKPSNAGIGAVTVNPAVVLGGVAMLAAGGGATFLDDGRSAMSGIGILMAIAGIIVLDEENSQSIEFSALDSQSAMKLGLSRSELDSFNSELDQANFILGEVHNELAQLKSPSLEDSKAAWSSVKDAVSPETFSAIQKISAQ